MPSPAAVSRQTSTPSAGTRAARPNGQGAGSGGVGGRKGNANHLLNFSLPARQEVHAPPRRSKRTGGGEGARWTLYNKEKFVNASFSFMLNPKGDYTAYFADSDIFFHWPDILQILVPGPGGVAADQHDKGKAAELPTCPICLSDPVAPRMTKCGHVYCYSCVLQYLALAADSKSARCPICNDSIHVKDLKSVRALPSIDLLQAEAPLAPRCDVPVASPSTLPSTSVYRPAVSASTSQLPQQSLRLIQRPQNTTLALPQSATWPSAAILPHEAPFHFLPDVTAFSRFMLASPEYILSELDADRRALEREKIIQRQAGETDLGLAFIDGALGRIADAVERLTVEIGAADGVVVRKVAAVRETMAKAEESARVKSARKRDRLERLPRAQVDAHQPPPTPSANVLSPTATPFMLGHSVALAQAVDPLFPETLVGDAPPSHPHALLEHHGHSLSVPAPPTIAKPTPLSASSKSSGLSTSPPKPLPPAKPKLPPSSAGLSDEPSFFFYQSADGRHIYLHPLDIRVLLAEFKTYAAFPERLVVGVEGTEEGTMNEDLRKRCKYLAHLPTGCAILFIQVDLAPHVSPATLAAFETPLRQRRQRRKEKGKREERERRKAEDREREEEEMQRRNLTADNFPSTWGHSSAGGGDDFEDALARSLWDVDGGDGEDHGDGVPSRPSTAPISVNSATSIWSSRSFAPPLSHHRSAEEDAEVAALWKQFEAQQLLETGGGRSGDRIVAGESSTGSGGAAAGGKKKKGRGQKLVLTGGGRGTG